MSINKNFAGFGLGLRPEHYSDIIDNLPPIDWLEILTENYLVPGGKPLYFLDKIRANYPMVMHGVSMSIGSSSPLNWDYLQQVKNLANRIQPLWISDHLCWTGANGINLHDLLPLPYTEEAISHVVKRIQQVQEFLGQKILIENVSSYVKYNVSSMPEWEFLTEISQRADCLILLDINNIYVSAYNHRFNPYEYINAIPQNKVKQFHLAGHCDLGDHIIDTHDNNIVNEVWKLYEHALKKFGEIATLIERDDNIPKLETLLLELNRAKTIMQHTLMEKLA